LLNRAALTDSVQDDFREIVEAEQESFDRVW
jgi:hypothetical protein